MGQPHVEEIKPYYTYFNGTESRAGDIINVVRLIARTACYILLLSTTAATAFFADAIKSKKTKQNRKKATLLHCLTRKDAPGTATRPAVCCLYTALFRPIR